MSRTIQNRSAATATSVVMAMVMGGTASATPIFVQQPTTAHSVGQSSVCDGLGAMLAYGRVAAKLDGWVKLEHGWDGEDGIPLGLGTAAAAKDFLVQAQGAELPCPEIYIAGDGEVGFRWRATGQLASIAFLDEGYIVAKVPTPSEAIRIDEPISELVDFHAVLTALRDFAHAA